MGCGASSGSKYKKDAGIGDTPKTVENKSAGTAPDAGSSVAPTQVDHVSSTTVNVSPGASTDVGSSGVSMEVDAASPKPAAKDSSGNKAEIGSSGAPVASPESPERPHGSLASLSKSDVESSLPASIAPQSGPARDVCSLRIFAVNDVYELDKLANLKTCIDQNTVENQVVLLAGDFLGPSLLSSLDHGRGMVDIMNRAGVQYVCFGNHEQDVPHLEMLQRIRESKFEWINTNMERLKVADDMKPLPTHKVVTVTGAGQTRKVGILGLNTDDPGLYLPASWGGQGAKVIDPIIDKAVEYRKKLLDTGCDIVLPMTHQVMPLDREMAEQRLGFPLIIGGHDHQLYHEEVAGATIIKMGADADTVGIIDLTWPNAETGGEAPSMTIQKIPSTDFVADPELVERIKMHKHVLDELDKATLFTVPDGVHLTSQRIRLQQVSMGTIIASSLRNALGAECAMVNAGNIRGNTDYAADCHSITYSNLKSEMPFDSVVADIPIPGWLINETVRFTRQFALQDPPIEKGSYMQLDDQMEWDAETNTVTHIKGEPLVPNRIYECVVLWQVAMEGIDKVTPLYDYCKQHLVDDKLFPHDADVGRPAKQVLVDYFGRAVWWHLIESVGFASMDTDSDEQISEEELRTALSKSDLKGDLGDLVIKNLMAMADLDQDGIISKSEFLQVSFLSSTMFEHTDMNEDKRLNRQEVETAVKKILGPSYDPAMVDELFSEIDTQGDGKLSLKEVKTRSRATRKALKI